MTDIRRDLLLQQGRLVLALILAHSGLFWSHGSFLRLQNPARHTFDHLCIDAVDIATPVFGLAVLEPILGPTSAGAVGLVALAINLTVPPRQFYGNRRRRQNNQQGADRSIQTEPILTGLQRWPEIAIVMGSNPRNRPRLAKSIYRR